LLTSAGASIESAADPADERFVLSAGQASAIVSMVGQSKCVDLGVLPPLLPSE
jgi:hypothetical protein